MEGSDNRLKPRDATAPAGGGCVCVVISPAPRAFIAKTASIINDANLQMR
jgi:hypothetical protein